MNSKASPFADIGMEQIDQAVASALGAVITDRAGTTTPDYRTRLAAAQLAVFYKFGKPADKMPAPQPDTPDDFEGMIARGKKSSRYRDEVLRRLRRFEQETAPKENSP